MAKPRIFVSSTYYDLKHIRKSIELFISEMGYDSVLFERGDIAFDHHTPLDDSCYKELDSCHILVLVIGGRYGSSASEGAIELTDDELAKHYQHFNSITKKEYETAKERDIPIYIFVEKGVAAEYQTYKENKSNETIKYAHVDSVNIFRLLDSIFSQKRNNLVREFENVDDITRWLKEQWAGLFTNFLIKKAIDAPIISLEKQLAKLNIVTETLKDYSENIIQGLSPDNYQSIIEEIDDKEKHRTEFSSFLRSGFVRHLIKVHDFDKDNLFDIFSKSISPTDFTFRLGDLTKQCAMIENSEIWEEDLAKLREDIGLDPWIRTTESNNNGSLKKLSKRYYRNIIDHSD